MRTFSQLLGRAPISGPLLAFILAGCDSPPPAFREEMNPYGTVYSGDATAAQDGADGDGSSDQGAAKDDHTAADREEEDSGLPAVASWSFQASTMEKGSLALNVSNGQIKQRFKMDNNVVPTRLTFNQVNRPVITEAFRQGSEQEHNSENFSQTSNASGLLDVLVVIDTSGSMSEEQANLGSKLMPLLSYVKDADWKIGVVTTDPAAGCLRGLIKKGDANANTLFANAINAGIQGSGNERGILQAVNGLKGECNQNGSWLRTNSTVAVLIVSDEDNCSLKGQDCNNGTDPWASADYLVNYMNSIRKVGVNARTYGLVWHPTVTQSACNTAANRAYVYGDAITRTGGTWGSICDADYSNTLSAISYDLSVILKSQFALKYEPFSGSLKVFVNNQLQTSGFKLTGNVLEFTNPPAAGSTIKVEYDFTTDPPKNEFFLANGVDTATLKVYLDGAETRNYTYDAAAKSIRFASAPMVYEIKTVYRKSGELKSDFQIGTSASATTVKVALNGVNTTGFSYSNSTGLVRMTTPPADSVAVSISFDAILTPNLRYPIYAAPSARNQVRVNDVKTGRAITVVVDGDDVVFQSRDFVALREVEVLYPMSGNDALTVDLGRTVVADSVTVKGVNSGACDTSKFTVSGTEVDMRACTFLASEAILIGFEYEASHRTSFDLGELDIDPAQYKWKVLVNNVETNDYTINQGMLSFPDLPMNAEITVSLFKN